MPHVNSTEGMVIWVALLPIMTMAACTPATTYSLTPTSTVTFTVPTPTMTKVPATSVTTDVVVSPVQFGRTITLSVGQTVSLLPPSTSVDWQITYSATLFNVLTAPEKMRAPGPQGWLFRAIAPGESEITLTSIVSPCPQPTPCGLIPMRFVVPVSIQR